MVLFSLTSPSTFSRPTRGFVLLTFVRLGFLCLALYKKTWNLPGHDSWLISPSGHLVPVSSSGFLLPSFFRLRRFFPSHLASGFCLLSLFKLRSFFPGCLVSGFSFLFIFKLRGFFPGHLTPVFLPKYLF